ncbi:MAG: poly(R)-hydroxyalkanoic acid synthase subunit PhaE [Pseudomonadota bacterium]|uniref:poly(R)-hydroxyalkanoic acid synthase subunit PhaE n=1 Tax=Sphingomonas sp. ERG5 TaxID=1381597 RepID=UPI000AF79112|nr:poly(R)-hydroxyalkanoic acid synthase subunit PhaE [Sphingomonas sp. ERG5]
MALPPTPDPSAFMREMLGQWETMANQFGGDVMKSGEFARVMQGATTAQMNAQTAAHQMMDKALAAANMPSRSEVEDLSARLRGVEETVGRIEALLMAQAGIKPPERPKPKRTRKPPAKA